MKKPPKWKTEAEDKVLVVKAKVAGQRAFRIEVEYDDVTDDEARAVRVLTNDIARLPRLLRIEKIVKGMFDDGILDPYPTSDGGHEYELRELTGWKSKR